MTKVGLVPRGIRNKNPGNLRKSKDRWQGLADIQSDPEFFQFKDPIYGIRALARTLITYQDRHGCNTIRRIVNRWAPPVGDRNGPAPGGEYRQDTHAYVHAVSRHCGVAADDLIDVHQYRCLRPLVEAIIIHENGQQPYSSAQIDKALVLAGVEPEKKPLAKSRTIAGSGITATSVVAAEAVQEVRDQVEPLASYADSLKWLFLALALAGIAITIWARLDDRKKGLR